MSDTIKLNIVNKKIKVKVAQADIDGSFTADQPKEDLFEKELQNQYNKGYQDGINNIKQQLETDYTNQLLGKSEEFYKILASFEEKLTAYESVFDSLVIRVSQMIAEKILKKEIENKSIIETTLKESLSKILGANEIIIKLNPADFDLINNGDTNVIDGSFSKIKFETDDHIEQGGCYIDTEIGNVDARLISQMEEISRNLTNKLVNVD